MVEGERREQVVGGDVDAAGDDREVGGLDELGQRLGAEVELVVAVDHGVEADAVQHLGLGLAGIGGEEERALEGVAGLEHEDVLALGGHLVAQRLRPRSRAARRRRSTRPRPRPRPEQVESKALIDSTRLWKSLKCATCRVKACAAPAESASAAEAKRAWRSDMGGPPGVRTGCGAA